MSKGVWGVQHPDGSLDVGGLRYRPEDAVKDAADRIYKDGYDTGRMHAGRTYGCAKRGCDRVNRPWESYGAYGKSWCLNHPPLRIRIRRWLGEDV